jgi:hypothetical protein
LYRDCSVQFRDVAWASLTDELLAGLNLHAIDGFGELAMHAGVVAAGDRVIAFPAESGQGKSTITAACLAAGFDYVSDEALCIEFASGRVIPYLKQVTLSDQSTVVPCSAVARPGHAAPDNSLQGNLVATPCRRVRS